MVSLVEYGDQMASINYELFSETSHSPALADLVGYDAAREFIDYCFIANPYYPTQAMIEEMQRELPSLIKAYPSSNPRLNNQHLADVLSVSPHNLIIGNGATELITAICDELIDSIGIPIPTFGEYIDKIDRSLINLYQIETQGYQLQLNHYGDWLFEHGLRSALIINPGNPTGQLFSVHEMQDFLQRYSTLDLVIVDESFIDFADEHVPTLLPYADRYSNLIIVRSMSKHCGIPGLRLGYIYTDNRYLLNKLRRRLPTWNINAIAELLLSQLPRTDAEYHQSRLHLINDLRWLYQQLDALPEFHVYPTGANFVMVKVDNGMTAAELQRVLLNDYKLYVRDCSNKQGMDKFHVRIASQGRAKDEPLVKALIDLSSEPATLQGLATT